MKALHLQALQVLRSVRGTQNVQLEYDDIMAASKVAAQVIVLHASPLHPWKIHCLLLQGTLSELSCTLADSLQAGD